MKFFSEHYVVSIIAHAIIVSFLFMFIFVFGILHEEGYISDAAATELEQSINTFFIFSCLIALEGIRGILEDMLPLIGLRSSLADIALAIAIVPITGQLIWTAYGTVDMLAALGVMAIVLLISFDDQLEMVIRQRLKIGESA